MQIMTRNHVGQTPWSARVPLDPLFGVLIAAALLASACSKTEKTETLQPAPVQVAAVTQATIHNVVGGDGTLYPYDQASVMPKISAPVQKFYVNRGDHVKQGQLLAELENRDLTAQVAEGQGAVLQAESNLRSTSGASIPESRSEEHTSELQSLRHLVCRLLLEK